MATEKMIVKLKDTDPMPFGKYKGTAMANVPAGYLIWFKENGYKNPSNTAVFKYIFDNWAAIQQEYKNEQDQKRTQISSLNQSLD